MFYTIQLRSSNKKSLKKYVNLFEKFLLLNKHRIKLVSLKQLPKSLHKKTFSFIRSPHVNSVSGEHLKYTIYTLNIRIYCYNYKQFNFFCKKVKEELFLDTKIYFKIEFDNTKMQLNLLHLCNPDKIKYFKKSTLTYLMNWDLYGERCFGLAN